MTRRMKRSVRAVHRALSFLAVWPVIMAVPASARASAQDPPARRPGMARPQTVPQEGGITFNFQNLDLASVITAMGQAAGINVLSTNLPEVLVNYRTPQPDDPGTGGPSDPGVGSAATA